MQGAVIFSRTEFNRINWSLSNKQSELSFLKKAIQELFKEKQLLLKNKFLPQKGKGSLSRGWMTAFVV